MAKKKRPYNRKYHLMTVDILDGMAIESAAKKHDIGTKQAAHGIFRRTAVNLFMFDDRKKIIENNYEINLIRELWRKSKIDYFK